jgi:acetyl esterase/lipase/lysophospholipase L1-like esterase
MIKHSFIFLVVLLSVLCVSAQTSRHFTLTNSADGQSTLTVYLPEHPSGRAVVDCPGGGYSHLAMDHEGHDWAAYFNRQGIAYAVLKYRMPNGDRTLPLSDAYHAIRTVRDSAAAWHINPCDVGIMGFSAGGHLASSVSTHADWRDRPDFSILFYPVITMGRNTHQGSKVNFLGHDHLDNKELVQTWSNEQAVRSHLTPPAVVLLANDDDVVPPVENGIAYYSAMRRAGNSCTLHVYPSGGHGFGFRPEYTYHEQMLYDLTNWLDHLKPYKQTALRVACIGNSITDGYGIDMSNEKGYPAILQHLLGDDYRVMNFGVSARTLLNKGNLPYMKEQAWRDALDFQPNIAIIKLGTNDSKIENWRYGKDFAHDLQQMIDSLKSLPTHPDIYLCSPIPAAKIWNIQDSVIVNEISPILKKSAKKNKLHFIDLHSAFHNNDGKQMQRDGIHPTKAGAQQLARIIAAEVKPAK